MISGLCLGGFKIGKTRLISIVSKPIKIILILCGGGRWWVVDNNHFCVRRNFCFDNKETLELIRLLLLLPSVQHSRRPSSLEILSALYSLSLGIFNDVHIHQVQRGP